MRVLLSPYPSQHFLWSVFDNSHFCGCEVVSHCGHSWLLSFYLELLSGDLPTLVVAEEFNYLTSLEIEAKFKPITKLKLCQFNF